MKCILNCVFCSCFDHYIPFAFKESLCFLHWILCSFLCLKPLALFCRYYSLELENIYFIFMSGFGLFWTWNAWVIHVVLSLSLLGVILVSFHMLIFQCLVGKIGSSFPCLFQREVLVFSLFCFIWKHCWMILFLFRAWLFEILDLTFIKKKHLFSALRALELDLFGNVSEIIFPLSFYASFSSMKR